MKTKHVAALSALTLIQAGCMMIQSEKPVPCDVRVMTFNIRYDTSRDGENRWDNRKALACEVIRDWESSCRRICTWVKLTDKASKQSFIVYNTHLDHKSQVARMKGMQLIVAHMDRRRAGQPAVLMGDLNVEEDNPVIAFLKGAETAETSRTTLVDTFRACHPDETVVGTYHSFTGDNNMKRIDYIFTTRRPVCLTQPLSGQTAMADTPLTIFR